MSEKPTFDLEKAKSLLAAGFTIDRDKLKEAANYLRAYLYTGNPDVDYADPQMMEAFDLMQLIHHLLAVKKK
jgi:hypothetical protein